MLLSFEQFRGARIETRNGPLGVLKEIYFSDQSWRVQHLVIQTHRGLHRKFVLISPQKVRDLNVNDREIWLDLSIDDLESSPEKSSHRPVSANYFRDLGDFIGIWGSAMEIGAVGGGETGIANASSWNDVTRDLTDDRDEHMHSSGELRGYGIEALDGEFGHVEDMLLDSDSWMVRYFIVDTINWWPSKSVLIASDWVKDLNWDRRALSVALKKSEIKNAPEFRLSSFTREAEDKLFEYFGKPKYWIRGRPAAMGADRTGSAAPTKPTTH